MCGGFFLSQFNVALLTLTTDCTFLRHHTFSKATGKKNKNKLIKEVSVHKERIQ